MHVSSMRFLKKFDMTGDERINPISLLIGISPLAVKDGDAYSKTLLAFGLFDIKVSIHSSCMHLC